MKFEVIYDQRVQKDLKKLKFSKIELKKLKNKIENISKNPYSKLNGGLGETLKGNLKGLMKFRFDNDYRVVYKVFKQDGVMKIIIIGLRSDKEVYHKANNRK
ncbi:type II toxin-antitoxin system mRNA interferase toxin, RelE/StbE family [Clostridiaceae bacterium HSG29]|nr:type II toxin-antitoxin system mRNA interferase toxin, RelE/StbE family [Clostridiaceae bacterium HSG29]